MEEEKIEMLPEQPLLVTGTRSTQRRNRSAASRQKDKEQSKILRDTKKAARDAIPKSCNCSKAKLCPECSFAKHEKSAYWSPKNLIRPNQIKMRSPKPAIFDCLDCGHEFTIRIAEISEGRWCGYCRGNKLCSSDECNYCYESSFASHPLAYQWSVKNTIAPRMVFKKTTDKYIFTCDCGHEHAKSLETYCNKSTCKYCTPGSVHLCGIETCNYCTSRSFASHPNANMWSPKNTLKPHQVTLHCATGKFMFDCNVCNHEILVSLTVFASLGRWCSYCSDNGRTLCRIKSCNHCFTKSFASVPNSAYWSHKNTKQPHELAKSCKDKYWFACQVCENEFTASLSNVSKGRWCPVCKNKTEAKLMEILQQACNNVQKEVRFEWCKNDKTGYHLPFDFVIESMKLIVELDGDQHFRQVKGWAPVKENRRRDWLKMRAALANGYSVVRILQDDVWRDKNDWYEIFMDNFQRYEVPELVFISGEGMYETFEDMLLDETLNEPDADGDPDEYDE